MKEKIFSTISCKHKIWLTTGKNKDIFGEGKCLLFKTIHRKGSLMAAVEELGMSYRKAWNDIKKTEDSLGKPIFEKNRGGQNHGSMCLTPDGQKLIRSYEHFHKHVDTIINKAYGNFYKELYN